MTVAINWMDIRTTILMPDLSTYELDPGTWPVVPRIGETIAFDHEGAEWFADVDEVIWGGEGHRVWLGTTNVRPAP